MNFKFIETEIEGCYVIHQALFMDHRGLFIKNFNEVAFKQFNLNCDFKESYFSVSNKNVIRGMHFQLPPHDYNKLATVVNGNIIDVVVDLRKNSKTFKKYIVVEMSTEKHQSIYIPRGCAHGFLSMTEGAVVSYFTTSVYSDKHDTGILYNSFGYNWPTTAPEITSKRDNTFLPLDMFDSPF